MVQLSVVIQTIFYTDIYFYGIQHLCNRSSTLLMVTCFCNYKSDLAALDKVRLESILYKYSIRRIIMI